MNPSYRSIKLSHDRPSVDFVWRFYGCPRSHINNLQKYGFLTSGIQPQPQHAGFEAADNLVFWQPDVFFKLESLNLFWPVK